MPLGDKSKYTAKQKRQAEHIEESYEKKGVSEEKAEEIAWSTVNKQDGGGNLSGSGRKNSASSAKSTSVKKSLKDGKDSSDRDSSASRQNSRSK